ncbi:hypothetical protein C5167_015983 [Papaver somniferum]|nr:hypothetical protein C5167_015983 [Papaver somniferum]
MHAEGYLSSTLQLLIVRVQVVYGPAHAERHGSSTLRKQQRKKPVVLVEDSICFRNCSCSLSSVATSL